MKLAEIAFACYIYSHMSDYDRSYLRFVKETSPQLDLRLRPHQMALLKWLNDWGCRQFSKDYHGLAAKEIGEWCEEFGARLFPMDRALLSLSDEDLALVEHAYDNLIARTASRKKRENGYETKVTVGPTGTAKILFAVRPNALIPWDEPIRERFGADNSARSYVNYLLTAKGHLEELSQECDKRGYRLSDLPQLLGRSTSSIVKMIDEYFWVTISRSCPVPSDDELMRWVTWQ